MSKTWKPNPFRILEKGWLKDFRKQQEEKLNADHSWCPPETSENANLPPIGGTYAIPLEDGRHTNRRRKEKDN